MDKEKAAGDAVDGSEKLALYFGVLDSGPGHYLYGFERGRFSGVRFGEMKIDAGRLFHSPTRELAGFPWDYELLDTGLLKNRRAPDVPDGRVYWTCGGQPLWHAFFWWDRSGDKRSNASSGFYVRGFAIVEREAAFRFACAEWPLVVARQSHPFVLEKASEA